MQPRNCGCILTVITVAFAMIMCLDLQKARMMRTNPSSFLFYQVRLGRNDHDQMNQWTPVGIRILFVLQYSVTSTISQSERRSLCRGYSTKL